MPKPKRHKSGGRSRRPRLPIAAIAVVLVIVGLIIYGCTAIKHQMNGYFGNATRERAATSQSPAVVETSPTAEIPQLGPSPNELVAPKSTGPKVAIIINDCRYNEERCKVFLQRP